MSRMHTPSRPGLGLVESVMAVMLTGVVLVSAMRVLGTVRAGELTEQRRAAALALAEGLMEEIVEKPYKDYRYSDAIGPGADEITGTRSAFDDVDDFDGWSASPPQDRDGTVLAGFEDYGRSVAIAWVDPDDLTTISPTSTGIKRITVEVTYKGRAVVTLVAYRTDAYNPETTP